MSLNIFGPSTTVNVDITHHPTLGFMFHEGKQTPTIKDCVTGSPADKIRAWRSRFRHGTIQEVNGNKISTKQQFTDHLTKLRNENNKTCTLSVAHEEISSINKDVGVPQLHFDQLLTIAGHLRAIRTNQDTSTESPTAHRIHTAAIKGATSVKLTRRKIQQLPDKAQWQQAEFKQHDAYEAQGMFGKPTALPYITDKDGNRVPATLLPFVWTYLYKPNGDQKARATCNGGKRYGRAVTLAHTYASCVEQPAARLFYGLAALENMIIVGADASNAFAEAPPPASPLFMKIDDQFREWWASKNRPPIPQGHVLPVNQAMQGHPESPRLWETHANKILRSLDFHNTTHERNIYSATIDNKKVLLLRQVDDFAIACTDKEICERVITKIGKRLKVPLHQLGIVTRFNGVDVLQTKQYVKISSESFLNKVLDNHDWHETIKQHNPIPMRDDNTYQSSIETAERPTSPREAQRLQEQFFNYRQAIGEAIYAMVTSRPDISFAVIKLSQYSSNPAKIHYQALRHLWKYLALTKTRGIHYWRTTPTDSLPDIPADQCITPETLLRMFPQQIDPAKILSYVDSDWGSDRTHRRSVTGMAHFIAGGLVAYKSRYQSTIALSSTEAEFTAATDAGKTVLYLRSILQELGYKQLVPTTLYEDNRGALYMANAEQPTKRTRHMDIKTFALQDWIQNGHLVMTQIPTANNTADHFTKALGRIKFYQQTDILMGRRQPDYTHQVTQPAISHLHYDQDPIETIRQTWSSTT